MYSKKSYEIVSVFFVLIALILLVIAYKYKEDRIENRLNSQLVLNDIYFKEMYENYRLLAENIHDIILNDPKVVEIFAMVEDANSEKRAKLRKDIQNIIQKKYSNINKLGFKQLQYHLSNNHSFLRMHRPTKFGDDLSDIRYSVKQVNETLKPVYGFEEGRLLNGFHFVYPVFDKNHKHLGSAEVTITSKSFIKRVMKAYHSDVHFIIKKSIVDSKLFFEEIDKQYEDSIISPNYYFEKNTSLLHDKQNHISQKSIKKLSRTIEKKIKIEKKFVLYSGFDKIISFLPVKNIKDKKVVAYFIIYTDDTIVSETMKMYWILNIAIFLILMIILYLIRKEFILRKKIQRINAELSIKIAKEVAKNRKKDQQMIQQSRLAQMGEMISMIAHQWRQPLGAISATSIDLNMQFELDIFDLKNEKSRKECQEYFKKSLKDIDGFIENLTTTVDDFRNFYKQNKKYEYVLITESLKRTFSIVKTSMKSNGIEIISRHESTKKVKILVSEIMQVFLNILKNAQDNFKEKNIDNPKIMFTCKDNEKGVVIEICDNGGGIAPEILPKIFDPYFSTKDEKNGSGLGLYMSKIIIEEHHNGSLHVRNINDGVCFIIILKDRV